MEEFVSIESEEKEDGGGMELPSIDFFFFFLLDFLEVELDVDLREELESCLTKRPLVVFLNLVVVVVVATVVVLDNICCLLFVEPFFVAAVAGAALTLF